MVRRFEKRSLRDFDLITMLLAVLIVIFGVWQIHNAQPTTNLWQKQLIGLVIALVAAIFIAFTDYRRLLDYAPIFYGIGLVLLVMVLIPGLGLKINGQRAWLKIPVIGQFQPSEFMKVPVVLMLARYFGARQGGALTLKEMFIGGTILAVPIGLIMLEPDAGQAITYFPLFAACIFLSAIKMRWVVASILGAAIAVPLLFSVGVKTGKIKPYQLERINVILDPDNADPRGYGYHTVQSMISVGKGGLIGSDADGEFSQSALKFLPEPQTDFIFAVTAENTGFVGCSLLFAGYAFLLSRMIDGAREVSDRRGLLVIMAFVSGITFQIFINAGMVLGLLPVIGVPLPLMSSGLSAILSTFIAIGFVISIRLRRFVN